MGQPLVTFREEDHSYTNREGTRYISCTTLIGKYHEKFDAPKVAKGYAMKMGKQTTHPDYCPEWKNPQYWVDKWEANTQEACYRGSLFHLKRELEELSLTGQTTSNREGYNYSSEDYTSLPQGIWLTELLVHDSYWEVAGQVDRVKFEGESFRVEDFKTNREIKLTSWCKETPTALSKLGLGEPLREYKMMYFPLNHIQDCNYNHYTLQLSLYAYLLERLTGKTCKSLTLLHHKPISETEVDPISVEYEVPYLKDEVELLLQHYFQKPLPEEYA